ncbi:MAG: hypothetical protein ABI845_07785 [Polaromonas sp.]
MCSKPESFKRAARTGVLLAAAALLTTLLGACAGNVLRPAAAAAAQSLPASAAAPVVATSAQDPVAAVSAVSVAVPTAGEELVRMLAYADRVRQMPPAELGQEVSRLGTPQSSFDQFHLALALSQLRQLPELIRAQELLARVLANAEAQALHPLARMLAARYGEQRRVEDQLDRQNQQTREVQRRLDQTNERLEALKAIERSLTSRPAASSPAPAGRTRPAAP